jgi:hypothetical protein
MGTGCKKILTKFLSITSCLIRNDYNVIFSFLGLIILNNFYNQNVKLFTKILIQMLAALGVFDLIWLIVMMPTWSHSSKDTNEHWNSLSGLHSFVTLLAFLELILKGLTVAYLFIDYKGKYPEEISKNRIILDDLWKFTYLESLAAQSN